MTKSIVEELNLQVGDEVLYIPRSPHAIQSIGKVVKITPSGMIDVQIGSAVDRFNPDGYSRSSSSLYGRSRIAELTPLARAKVEHQQLQAKISVLMDRNGKKLKDLSLEDLRAIDAVLSKVLGEG